MSNYVPPTTPFGGSSSQPFPPQQSFPPPPEKKSNVWAWVLVGCGTFVLLGIIGVVLGGYFVWNKAKQAGLDPDLMKKHPAVATAKLMAALNPDIEIVSVDEEKELITVKDKKTGRTVTVSLDKAKDGKVVFSADGEEPVSIEARGDDSKASLEVKSADGSAKFGTNSVSKLPEWVPAYPDTQFEGSYSAESKDGASGGFHFTTTDPPKKILSFYETELKRAGMSVNTTFVSQNEKTASGTATAESADKNRKVYINAAVNNEGSTMVTVIFASK
jgi:VCBS repeat-containing protein